MGMTLFPDICFLTPEYHVRETVKPLLDAGLRWIQYRAKTKPGTVLHSEAISLRTIAREYGALFVVNDRIDIAIAVSSDGVHLGQDDLPLPEARHLPFQGIIGISTHSVDEALKAELDGADYIGYGPIFASRTKDAGLPRGTDMLREIVCAVRIPVIAIGGITVENAESVFRTGCAGIAISAGLQGKGGPDAVRILAEISAKTAVFRSPPCAVPANCVHRSSVPSEP